MPRHSDLQHELAFLEKKITTGQGDRRDKQRTVRLDAEIDLCLIRDCIARGGEPTAVRVRAIVSDYYRAGSVPVSTPRGPSDDEWACLEYVASKRKTTPQALLSSLLDEPLRAALVAVIREIRTRGE